jgi:hypothetical protein
MKRFEGKVAIVTGVGCVGPAGAMAAPAPRADTAICSEAAATSASHRTRSAAESTHGP